MASGHSRTAATDQAASSVTHHAISTVVGDRERACGGFEKPFRPCCTGPLGGIDSSVADADWPAKTARCLSEKGLRNRWIVSSSRSSPGGSPVPAPSVADDHCRHERVVEKRGVPNPLVGTIQRNLYADTHRAKIKSWTDRGLRYSTASVTKWPTLSPSATASAKSASPWTSGFGSFSMASSISFNSYSP